MKFRFHVIGIPFTRTNTNYMACPFTQKLRLFCMMMHQRGHYIMHYGTEGSDPDCDENINVLSNEDYNKDYGMNNNATTKAYNQSLATKAYNIFTKNTIKEIAKRKQPNDIILAFYGNGAQEICDAHNDLIIVEPGIGYHNASFAPFRVYESNMMRTVQDVQREHWLRPDWYNVVIPAFFNIFDFNYNPHTRSKSAERYFFFMGRIGNFKGLQIAKEVCQKLGEKLVVAGPIANEAEAKILLDGVDYVGVIGLEERKKLYQNAVATFIPSIYSEPFGYVQVESMLSGTPIITTDWGAFPEVNKEGVSGYRCRTFDDFINAAINCLEDKISFAECRKVGLQYGFDQIAPKYEKYFEDLIILYSHQEGWYYLKPDTVNRLNKLKK